MKRGIAKLSILLTVPTLLAACASTPSSPWETLPIDPSIRQKTFQAMGTRFIIRLWLDPKDKRPVETLYKPALLELSRVARILDADNPKSEISNLNALAATHALQISPDLATVLVISQKLNERSGGVFDITFAPLQDKIESFGPDAGLNGADQEIMPSGVDKETRARLGQKLWSLDVAHRMVRFSKPGIKLVVKGLAKGYAAQKAAEKLLALKLRGFAVVAGNSFVAAGVALNDPRLMCIEDSTKAGGCRFRVKASRTDKLFSLGVAASSDRPGHNYNPKDGSRTYRMGTAAVAGPDGAWTQGAATATSILQESAFENFFKVTHAPDQPKLSGMWTSESANGPLGNLAPYATVSESTATDPIN